MPESINVPQGRPFFKHCFETRVLKHVCFVFFARKTILFQRTVWSAQVCHKKGVEMEEIKFNKPKFQKKI